MSLALMQVFNQYVMPATIETLGQMVAKFNEASGNTIVLTNQGFEGDFMESSFYAALHGAQRRVDRYANQADVTATDLSQLREVGVKVAGGFGPIRFEPSQLTWLQKPTAEGIEAISRNMAEAILKDQLNTAVASAVAAIENQGTATTNDVSASAALDYIAVNGAHAKFGDRSQAIRSTVMDGAAFHRFIEGNLTNANRLFEQDNVQVVDILGRRVVVTDAPALREAGTPNKVKALGLVEQGVVVYDGGDVISNIETKNGKTRIETTMQADYTFGLAMTGYAWDKTNGGKSPSDADLGTGSNWDKVMSDIKHTAGVLAIGDAAL